MSIATFSWDVLQIPANAIVSLIKSSPNTEVTDNDILDRFAEKNEACKPLIAKYLSAETALAKARTALITAAGEDFDSARQAITDEKEKGKATFVTDLENNVDMLDVMVKCSVNLTDEEKAAGIALSEAIRGELENLKAKPKSAKSNDGPLSVRDAKDILVKYGSWTVKFGGSADANKKEFASQGRFSDAAMIEAIRLAKENDLI